MTEDFHHASTDYGPLTEKQAENIADLAARRAEDRVYAAIGKALVRKVLYLLGALGLAGYAWLNGLFVVAPVR